MKNDDVMDLIVVFCILFVFMLVLYCLCVATEFSVNKDLYKRQLIQVIAPGAARRYAPPPMAVRLAADLRPSADGSTDRTWLSCRQPAYL